MSFRLLEWQKELHQSQLCWDLSSGSQLFKAFSSGMSNVIFLAFDTPNTKILDSWDVSNAKRNSIMLPCNSKVALNGKKW